MHVLAWQIEFILSGNADIDGCMNFQGLVTCFENLLNIFG